MDTHERWRFPCGLTCIMTNKQHCDEKQLREEPGQRSSGTLCPCNAAQVAVFTHPCRFAFLHRLNSLRAQPREQVNEQRRRVGILHGLTYRANSAQRPRPLLPSPDGGLRVLFVCSKTTQRNKQIAMGRKKFNMDPKKVTLSCCGPLSLIWVSTTWMS